MTDELHQRIMNLPCRVPFPHTEEPEEARAYKLGHRDARHAAAELVPASPSSVPAPAQMQMSDAFEVAMKQTWQMVDPLNPPPAGSYYRGEYEGIIAALRTVRENFARALLSAQKMESAEGVPADKEFTDAAIALTRCVGMWEHDMPLNVKVTLTDMRRAIDNHCHAVAASMRTERASSESPIGSAEGEAGTDGVAPCRRCNGDGELPDPSDPSEMRLCPACKGTGRTDGVDLPDGAKHG